MEIDVGSRKPFTDILKALDEPNDDECIDIGKPGRGPKAVKVVEEKADNALEFQVA